MSAKFCAHEDSMALGLSKARCSPVCLRDVTALEAACANILAISILQHRKMFAFTGGVGVAGRQVCTPDAALTTALAVRSLT